MKESCEFQSGEYSFLLLYKRVNHVMPLFLLFKCKRPMCLQAGGGGGLAVTTYTDGRQEKVAVLKKKR
jgi:hypothetical protein